MRNNISPRVLLSQTRLKIFTYLSTLDSFFCLASMKGLIPEPGSANLRYFSMIKFIEKSINTWQNTKKEEECEYQESTVNNQYTTNIL